MAVLWCVCIIIYTGLSNQTPADYINTTNDIMAEGGVEEAIMDSDVIEERKTEVVDASTTENVMDVSAAEDVMDPNKVEDVMNETSRLWSIPPLSTEEPFTDISQYPEPDPPLVNFTCHGCSGTVMSAEKRLIKGLMQNYEAVGKSGRPVYNISQQIDVDFGLGLIQMDLDEKYKILKMSMWSKYKWRDEYLRWDPAEYNDITKIRLSPELVWIPDIMLYNTADPENKARKVLTIVQFDGVVIWIPHQIFQSSCSIDVTNFPFDSQTCHMWFGSWTYTRQEVDVHMSYKDGIDLSTFQSDYKESSEWDITGTVAEKKIMPAANETPSYAVLTFQLDMRRKLTFSSYILTLPCVFLACLTLVVFWLPPDRPDRTALAMSIFASFLVLLLILVEAAPPTASSVPVLGVYYCFCMVIIMLSVFLSSLVVNICRAGESRRPVPRWLRLLTLECLSRFLLMHRTEEDIQDDVTEDAHRVDDSAATHADNGNHYQLPPPGGGGGGRRSHRDANATPSTLCCDPRRKRQQHHFQDCYEMTYCAQDNNVPAGQLLDNKNYNSYDSCSMNGDMKAMLDEQVKDMKRSLHQLKTSFVDRVHTSASTQSLCREWRDVALVLDRFFFIMYIILIVVSLSVLFPRPKY